METSGLSIGLAPEQQTQQKAQQCSTSAVVTEMLRSRDFQVTGPGASQNHQCSHRYHFVTGSCWKILKDPSKPPSLPQKRDFPGNSLTVIFYFVAFRLPVVMVTICILTSLGIGIPATVMLFSSLFWETQLVLFSSPKSP